MNRFSPSRSQCKLLASGSWEFSDSATKIGAISPQRSMHAFQATRGARIGLPSHCDLPTIIALAGVECIGLYHIKSNRRADMQGAIKGHPRLFVPEASSQLVA